MSSKDLLFGNVMPAALTPVATGDARADEAIGKLQAWPHSPYTPASHPSGKEYKKAITAAEKVGPAKLLALLDDAAVQTGESRWSDQHWASLETADRKAFRKHYDEVIAAVAVRKAYLQWLIGAVCGTPEGLTRALAIVTGGTTDARLVAAAALRAKLEDATAKRRFADALDLRKWDGKDRDLERVYRAGVGVLASLDAAGGAERTFDRYSPLLTAAALKKPGGVARAESLLFGVLSVDDPDPRWTPVILPLLETKLDNLALMLLEKLPPDPTVVEPVCDYLPAPGKTKQFWNQTAVRVLARSADARALPKLVGALAASWMNWPAVFEGFRRVGDPSMAHVIREWLKDNGASDRNKVGRPLIKELEAKGAAPKPAKKLLVKEAEPTPKRPVLKFKKTGAFKKPKLDSLATQTEVYAKAFEDAGLARYFDRIVQRAVLMIPRRVDEADLAAAPIGGTKLGGHPDLPAATEWPRVEGEPLTFVAQIALAEVAPHLPKKTLPSSGLLSFFVGDDPSSTKAGYCEHARVLFTPSRSKLVRRDLPEDFVSRIYQAATVELHAALRLPSPSNAHVTRLLKGDKLARYEEDVFVDAPALPQLLGYRNHGYDAEEPATAQMLLQLTGDSQTGMQFGDCDYLSFFIDEKKLAEADFSNVWPHVGD